MIDRLFPELSEQLFGQVNMDQLAQEELARRPGLEGKSKEVWPFVDPAFVQLLVEQEHRRLAVRYSYGGYLENRSILLRKSYLSDSGAFLHLGVDFSVPVGTLVAAGVGGRVLAVDDDHDENLGWGPRVIVGPVNQGSRQPVLVYAHLKEVGVRVGQRLDAGQNIGVVGAPPQNGNWWPHLHVQAISPETFRAIFPAQLDRLDGYGNPTDSETLRAAFPDPLAQP